MGAARGQTGYRGNPPGRREVFAAVSERDDSMPRPARLSCWLVLVLVLVMGGCAEKLTGPSFELAGTWSGTFIDYMVKQPGKDYFTGTITLTIEPDGLGAGTARANYTSGNFQVNTRLTLDLIVYPDGAVTGTGDYLWSMTGYYSFRGSGEVIGQLDVRSGRGDGVLAVVLNHNQQPFHVPWTVSRSK